MANKEIKLRTLEIGPDVRHYFEGRIQGIRRKQVCKQREVFYYVQPYPSEGGRYIVQCFHNVAANILHIVSEITLPPTLSL